MITSSKSWNRCSIRPLILWIKASNLVKWLTLKDHACNPTRTKFNRHSNKSNSSHSNQTSLDKSWRTKDSITFSNLLIPKSFNNRTRNKINTNRTNTSFNNSNNNSSKNNRLWSRRPKTICSNRTSIFSLESSRISLQIRINIRIKNMNSRTKS